LIRLLLKVGRWNHTVKGGELYCEYEERGFHSRFCADRAPLAGDAIL
jgi:hypothetical protein